MHRTRSTHLTGCSAEPDRYHSSVHAADVMQAVHYFLGACSVPLPLPSRPAAPLHCARARRRGKAYECCGGLWAAACAVPHTDAPARDAAWCGGARPRPHGQVRSALATATRRRLCARTAQRIHCGPCGLLSADLWLAHPIGSSGASACRAEPDTVFRMRHPEGLYCVLHPNMVYAASLHVVPEQTPS